MKSTWIVTLVVLMLTVGPSVGSGATQMGGGDTCDTATVIGALPYTDAGTTTGFTNDYDETCPNPDSLSPDVVYSYTPAVDEFIDISTCSGGGDAFYDTKIYVYENVCGSPALDCSDDACQAPSYPDGPYNSELVSLSLTAGNTYYIVVDGYLHDYGDFVLHVESGTPPPPSPTCALVGDPGFLIGQDAHGPDDNWSAGISGQAIWQTAQYVVAESIDQAVDPDWFNVASINVWGFSLSFIGGSWSECNSAGMTFAVKFYEDNAGVPGAVICDLLSVPAVITDTGLNYGEGFNLLQFDIAATCDLGSVGRKWVSVQSESMAAECSFGWVSASSGDGMSPRDTDDDGIWETDYLFDSALCINGAGGIIFSDGFETGDAGNWN
ncbi:MAG: hypothetical protein ABFS37_08330 [Acidobacteriota bacterium]